jgi:hypothetical protein
MHATDLVDMAGFISTHANLLFEQHSKWAPIANEKYWAASKCRLDRWGRSLKLFQTDVHNQNRVYSPWPAIELVADEILVSELLTRVWAAVACIHDQIVGDDVFEAVARSVLIGHLEARNRVLKLMMIGHRQHRQEASALNRVRNKVERWTDLLLGNLHHHMAREFGYDAQRVDDFAQDNHDLISNPDSPSWHLMMSTLHQSFLNCRKAAAMNCDLNESIFASLMSCFPTDVFDSTGSYHSLWLLRIANSADQTERLIETMLRSELPA